MTTTKTDLSDSRVRVDVEVGADAVEREIGKAAGDIGRDLKLPGFRKGKVPPPVVLQRLGRRTVLDEAIRNALPAWYQDALLDAGVVTVGDPKVDLAELPDKGSPLTFSFEVGVRPRAELGEYRGLEAGRREAKVDPDELETELERLRESLASLDAVERQATQGDFVVIDFVGRVDGEPFEGGEARGYVLELGSKRLVEGFEDQLLGAGGGEERNVRVTFPDDHGADALAGKEAVFDVSVKEVKEKRLPELDDDFATEAGGFDTLDELKGDIGSKLKEIDEQRVEREFREAAVDAAVAEAKVDLPNDLVHAKAHEMWENTARRLAAQGLEPARYLELTNKTEEQVVEEAQPEAQRGLARESVLAAIVDAEGIEVTDDEVVEALRQATAAPGQPEPDDEALRKSLEEARKNGRDGPLREDIAMRKAVDLLVEHASAIPVEQAEAREELWTPEKEGAEKSKRLWTPG